MDLPSLSISTALVEPHMRPSGSFAQPAMVWKGLGSELVGWTSLCRNNAMATRKDTIFIIHLTWEAPCALNVKCWDVRCAVSNSLVKLPTDPMTDCGIW